MGSSSCGATVLNLPLIFLCLKLKLKFLAKQKASAENSNVHRSHIADACH